MQAILYVVATPIGNLEDITLRALRILRECDVVLCEDTRVTKKLLTHYELSKPLISYHAYSGAAKYDKVYALLEEGKCLALVTDAGTPAISDPGAQLIERVRSKFGQSVRIEVVPGPSAVAATLSVAGIQCDSFLFLGFPPHKKGRKTFFDTVVESAHTTIFYESPHRILKALKTLAERLTAAEQVTVCRELTKVYEEVVNGSSREVLTYFENNPDKVRGEFVVVVSKP